MKKFALILLFMASVLASYSQESIHPIALPEAAEGCHRTYAELLAYDTAGFNKSVTVRIDLGQYQSVLKSYKLLDDKGKAIKFNSMVAAMNYMGERGWKFVQVYVVKDREESEVHWLMYKDVTSREQIYEGLRISDME